MFKTTLVIVSNINFTLLFNIIRSHVCVNVYVCLCTDDGIGDEADLARLGSCHQHAWTASLAAETLLAAAYWWWRWTHGTPHCRWAARSHNCLDLRSRRAGVCSGHENLMRPSDSGAKDRSIDRCVWQIRQCPIAKTEKNLNWIFTTQNWFSIPAIITRKPNVCMCLLLMICI